MIMFGAPMFGQEGNPEIIQDVPLKATQGLGFMFPNICWLSEKKKKKKK